MGHMAIGIPSESIGVLEASRHSKVQSAPTVRGTPDKVWERLWSGIGSQSRSDELLSRERVNARWILIRNRLRDVYGSIRGLRTIELGSGRGDLSALLAQEGAEVTLLDASASALRHARERFARLGLNATFVVGDLFALHKELSRQFDVALSSGVMEHFVGGRRIAGIESHRRALRDGGMAIISVPNAACLPYRMWKLYLELRGWWPYGLESPFSATELRRAAEEVHLQHVTVDAVGFWQSVGDHILRGLFKTPFDWAGKQSRLDGAMGMSLVLMGRYFSTRTKNANALVQKHFSKRGRGPEFDMECKWLLRRIPTSARSILDIGCGSGGLLHRLGYQNAIGIDWNAEGLRALKIQTHGARVAVGDATKLPFRDRSIDVLLHQHVIEHLYDPVAAVSEWKRVLKPGGELLIVTPNAQFADPRVFADDTHVEIFNRSSLVNRLVEGGFEIIDQRSLGLPTFRSLAGRLGTWRLRHWIIKFAHLLSTVPGWKDRGQSLVCAARKSME